MNNTPEVKIGIVAVSRDCFPGVSFCQQKKSISGKPTRLNMTLQKFTNVLYASWRARYIWFRH